MSTARVGIICLLLVLYGALAEGQPSGAVLRWTASVPSAQADVRNPRVYRIYEGLAGIPVVLTLFNESRSSVVLEASRFATQARIVVNGAQEGMLRVDWDDTWTTAPGVPVPADRVVLEPGEGVAWIFRIVRSDNTTIEAGTYDVSLDLSEAFGTLTDVNEDRWSGNAAPRTDLRINITGPSIPSEQAAAYRLRADEALVQQKSAEAERLYLVALQFSPSDAALLSGLGHALLQQNKYRQAIAVYEQVLPMLRGQRTGVPLMLALAYVAVGDEQNGARALRLEGRSDSDVVVQLRRLREQVRRRAR